MTSAAEFYSRKSERNITYSLKNQCSELYRDLGIHLQCSHTHPLFTNCPLLTVSASMQIFMKSSVRWAKKKEKDSEMKQLKFQNATLTILKYVTKNT